MKHMRSNLKLFFLAVGVVSVWRGVWGLSDIYLFPNEPVLSFVLSTIVGLAIIYLNDRKINELF